MTESRPEIRNSRSPSWALRGLVLLVLLAATVLRLDGIGFGLPALNDPDEPLFMMTAFEMLHKQSLNPGWFGHPATTTFYSLALVLAGVAGTGLATGHFADLRHFADAAYLDPGIAWLPARVLMAAFGVACVWLVWRIARRLGGDRVGIVAALFLAVNAIHVEYSQIIRTDMQATLFMLLSTLCALNIVERGQTRDYVLAGVFAGLACATKWPTALVFINPLCAGFWRLRADRSEWRKLLALGIAAPLTLFLVSPFLLIDWRTVVDNLVHEARPIHPGAMSGGFFANMGWYVVHGIVGSFGMIGAVLVPVGIVAALRRAPRWSVAVLPVTLVFFIVICAQALLWERWIVPLLPFAAIAAAYGLCWLVGRLPSRRPDMVLALWAITLALPMLLIERTMIAERTHDTRQMAAAWVRGHVPAGSSIVVEHAAFDILHGPWRFRFPLGSLGCVDVASLIAGHIHYSKVETARHGSPLVDIGHVDDAKLESCRADYAIFTIYGRYRDRPDLFPAELARYESLRAGRPFAAVFRPEPGESSGPVVYVLRLRP